MENDEILLNAIKIAVKNGWNPLLHKFDEVSINDGYAGFYYSNGNGKVLSTNDIIFDHRFAKAFWGEADFITGDTDNYGEMIHMPRWKFNLSKIVIEDNPFKYLEKFI